MVDIKEIVGASVLNRNQITANRAPDETVSNFSKLKKNVDSSGVHDTNSCTGDRYGDSSCNVVNSELGVERNQCSCRCHYQRNSPRNCPFKSKSPKHPGFSTSETTGKLSGETLCELHRQLTSVTKRSVTCSESLRKYTSSRNRLKKEPLRLNKNEKSSSEQESVHKNWRTRLTQKKTMLRILIQGFVVVLCLCGGVLMFNHHGSSKGNKIHKLPSVGFYPQDTKSSGKTDIVKDLPFKSVPLDVLDQHVGDSAADILKLFFDRTNLTDEDVNSIMWMKSHQYLHGSGVTRKQRNYNVMSDVGESEEELRDEAVRHNTEVKMSALGTCSEPKPELEHVEDPQRFSIRYLFPHCTILHRCRNTTGCCRRGYECGPRKINGIEIVHKHFLVFVSTFDGSVVPDTKSFVEIKSFINHTACECHKIKTETNCHKKCPHQFRKERIGADCRCTCKQNNKRCRHMYRGLIPLDEEDLFANSLEPDQTPGNPASDQAPNCLPPRCIKEGKCLKPECHTGDFKVHTGFCPQFRHHHRHRHNS